MAHKHEHDEDSGQSASTAYETRDIKLRPLIVFAAGIAVMGVVSYLIIFVLLGFFSGLAARQDAQLAPASLAQPQAPGEERLPPEPRIQANPAGDLKVLRDQEELVLTTYGWVDAKAGVVRVPIDVAMRLVLEEGLPVRQPESALPAAGTPALPKQLQGHTKKASK